VLALGNHAWSGKSCADICVFGDIESVPPTSATQVCDIKVIGGSAKWQKTGNMHQRWQDQAEPDRIVERKLAADPAFPLIPNH
jgi:hypothetical protein